MTEEYKGVVPYLFYDDAEAAIQGYTRVFGFEEISRWTNDNGLNQNSDGMGHLRGFIRRI